MISRIKQKIKEIEEDLELINNNLPDNYQEFKSLGLIKDGIFKRLENSIQNLIDIFSLVYSSLNLGVPSSLDDIFDGLREKKVFPAKIVILVQEMKGLRNILVHRYGKIDDKIVYELLKERIDDFEKVISAVEKFLQSR